MKWPFSNLRRLFCRHSWKVNKLQGLTGENIAYRCLRCSALKFEERSW